MTCELCELAKGNVITHKYYEDKFVIVVACQTCHVPMGVVKRHTMVFSEEEHRSLIKGLNKAGTEVFGKRNYWFDRKQKKIKDHLHLHARRK
ncbi:hypothetical protein ES703_63975 [subsurface metagenome]